MLPPVLLLIFNRPDATSEVLATLRAAGVGRLYVAADGPRPGHPTDLQRCAEAREAARPDWPCEVRTLFRSNNLGCSNAVAGALDWFFAHEPEGIVVEDDCRPTTDFFSFCAALLARYRHHPHVLHIGGNNFGAGAGTTLAAGAPSYRFSQQVHSWGWATWRRAWRLYDLNLSDLPELAGKGKLTRNFSSRLEATYFMRKFWELYRGPRPFTTWDYQWHFARAAAGGLSIVPSVNLVTNIGFGHIDATHTRDAHDPHAARPTGRLHWPLCHPTTVQPDRRHDRREFRSFLAGRFRAKLRGWKAQVLGQVF